MERVLPILRKLNRLHLLVVVFFENTEIEEFGKQQTESIRDIYCLLYTSDAADERSSVDLGGRRIIKKKNRNSVIMGPQRNNNNRTRQ